LDASAEDLPCCSEARFGRSFILLTSESFIFSCLKKLFSTSKKIPLLHMDFMKGKGYRKKRVKKMNAVIRWYNVENNSNVI